VQPSSYLLLGSAHDPTSRKGRGEPFRKFRTSCIAVGAPRTRPPFPGHRRHDGWDDNRHAVGQTKLNSLAVWAGWSGTIIKMARIIFSAALHAQSAMFAVCRRFSQAVTLAPCHFWPRRCNTQGARKPLCWPTAGSPRPTTEVAGWLTCCWVRFRVGHACGMVRGVMLLAERGVAADRGRIRAIRCVMSPRRPRHLRR
jgi:hypothetical protein